jgi:hypothetical protein
MTMADPRHTLNRKPLEVIKYTRSCLTSSTQDKFFDKINASSTSIDFCSTEDEPPSITEDRIRSFFVDYYDDLNTATNLQGGASSGFWNVFYSDKHSSNYRQITPDGFAIDTEVLIARFTSDEMVLHQSSLISVDNVILMLAGKAAVVTYTADNSYTFHGEKHEDRSVTTAVMELQEGQIKLVQEHKSRGCLIPKVTRWSSSQLNESADHLLYQSHPEDSTIELDHMDSVAPLKDESPRRSQRRSTMKRVAGARPTSHSPMRELSAKRMQLVSPTTSSGRMKKVGSVDTMLRKPERTCGLPVSCEVLSWIEQNRSSHGSLPTPRSEPIDLMLRQPNESWGNTTSSTKHADVTPHKAIAMAGLLVKQPSSRTNKMAPSRSTSTTMSNDLRQQMLREMLPAPVRKSSRGRTHGGTMIHTKSCKGVAALGGRSTHSDSAPVLSRLGGAPSPLLLRPSKSKDFLPVPARKRASMNTGTIEETLPLPIQEMTNATMPEDAIRLSPPSAKFSMFYNPIMLDSTRWNVTGQ